MERTSGVSAPRLLRAALIAGSVAAAWVVLGMASSSASASENPDQGGGLLGAVSSVVTSVEAPVAQVVHTATAVVAPAPAAPPPAPAPVPAAPAPAPSAPAPTTVSTVVSHAAATITSLTSSAPVGAIVTPVAGALDGVIHTVTSPILGDTPVSSTLEPVTGTVDDLLDGVGTTVDDTVDVVVDVIDGASGVLPSSGIGSGVDDTLDGLTGVGPERLTGAVLDGSLVTGIPSSLADTLSSDPRLSSAVSAPIPSAQVLESEIGSPAGSPSQPQNGPLSLSASAGGSGSASGGSAAASAALADSTESLVIVLATSSSGTSGDGELPSSLAPEHGSSPD